MVDTYISALCDDFEVDQANGEVVTTLGARVDPDQDLVRVDGERVVTSTRSTYMMLNKPRGVVSTMDDDQGRESIGNLLAGRTDRLFHVGRLDTDTEGLILLTNDGDFAQRVAHPSYELSKTYVAEVEGVVTKTVLGRLLGGVAIEGRPVQVRDARLVSNTSDRSIVELVIHEGRNRIVRRLLDHVGHPVRKLTRIAIGPIQLTGLKVGELRELTNDELGGLLDAAQL